MHLASFVKPALVCAGLSTASLGFCWGFDWANNTTEDLATHIFELVVDAYERTYGTGIGGTWKPSAETADTCTWKFFNTGRLFYDTTDFKNRQTPLRDKGVDCVTPGDGRLYIASHVGTVALPAVMQDPDNVPLGYEDIGVRRFDISNPNVDPSSRTDKLLTDFAAYSTWTASTQRPSAMAAIANTDYVVVVGSREYAVGQVSNYDCLTVLWKRDHSTATAYTGGCNNTDYEVGARVITNGNIVYVVGIWENAAGTDSRFLVQRYDYASGALTLNWSNKFDFGAAEGVHDIALCDGNLVIAGQYIPSGGDNLDSVAFVVNSSGSQVGSHTFAASAPIGYRDDFFKDVESYGTNIFLLGQTRHSTSGREMIRMSKHGSTLGTPTASVEFGSAVYGDDPGELAINSTNVYASVLCRDMTFVPAPGGIGDIEKDIYSYYVRKYDLNLSAGSMDETSHDQAGWYQGTDYISYAQLSLGVTVNYALGTSHYNANAYPTSADMWYARTRKFAK